MRAAPRAASAWRSDGRRRPAIGLAGGDFLAGALSEMQRLRTRAQFQALLAHRPVARTTHFALHHLPTLAQDSEAGGDAQRAAPGEAWLGAMTPKRWARRAVTRNAIRRQIYAVGESVLAGRSGARLVRLRAAFSPQSFPSASSTALKRAVRTELLQLLDRALR